MKRGLRLPTYAGLAAVALLLVAAEALTAQGPVLAETGSSSLFPLFALWVPAYTQSHPGARITAQSTNSGAGIAQAVSGAVQIGASDAYLSDDMMSQNPGMLNIPLVVSSQIVTYNLPGLNGRHLRLSGSVLSSIYQGQIIKWNAPDIAQLNPGVKLPDHAIVPIHRTDSSGDTFVFTQYLSESSTDWAGILGYGTTVTWPSVLDDPGAIGNQGMLNALQRTPYSIGYISVSFSNAMVAAKLGEAMLENRAGAFVLPTSKTVQAALASTAANTPKDERARLIFEPGAQSYPIVNYEFAIVKARQPDAQSARAIRDFLGWAIRPNGGNAERLLRRIGCVPLPEPVRKLGAAQIARITG